MSRARRDAAPSFLVGYIQYVHRDADLNGDLLFVSILAWRRLHGLPKDKLARLQCCIPKVPRLLTSTT
jgi:hypothetical protein